MNRIAKLVEQRNELAAGITYVRAALDVDAIEQTEFDAGVDYVRTSIDALAELDRQITDLESIRDAAVDPRNVSRGDAPMVIVKRDLPDPFDTRDISVMTSGAELRGRARTAIEQMPDVDDSVRHAAAALLDGKDTRGNARTVVDPRGEIALRMLLTGSEAYRSGFQKIIGGADWALTEQEREVVARAASLTGNAGGFAVPFTLDPTMIFTNDGVNDPVRQLARVVTITTDDWNGVSTAGVTASWDGEAGEVSDDAPTLAQPSISVHKAQAFVPFSIEVGQDWANLEADMRMAFLDARDRLEGAAFVSGSGSSQPFGITTALDGGSYELAPTSAETFALADISKTIKGLGARFRNPRTATMAHFATIDKIRSLLAAAADRSSFNEATEMGAARLYGYPLYENSSMRSYDSFNAAATADNFLMVSGDWSNYVIVDRAGLNVELIPHLFHTGNNRPSGQRGFYAWWRVGADSVNDAAFRMLSIPTAA